MILPSICTWLVIIIMAESQAAITAISRLQNQSNKPNLLLRGTDNCVKRRITHRELHVGDVFMSLLCWACNGKSKQYNFTIKSKLNRQYLFSNDMSYK